MWFVSLRLLVVAAATPLGHNLPVICYPHQHISKTCLGCVLRKTRGRTFCSMLYVAYGKHNGRMFGLHMQSSKKWYMFLVGSALHSNVVKGHLCTSLMTASHLLCTRPFVLQQAPVIVAVANASGVLFWWFAASCGNLLRWCASYVLSRCAGGIHVCHVLTFKLLAGHMLGWFACMICLRVRAPSTLCQRMLSDAFALRN